MIAGDRLPGLDVVADYTDAQLVALAKVLASDHVRWCSRVLAFNRSTPAIRDACRRDLRAALGVLKPGGDPRAFDPTDIGPALSAQSVRDAQALGQTVSTACVHPADQLDRFETVPSHAFGGTARQTAECIACNERVTLGGRP